MTDRKLVPAIPFLRSYIQAILILTAPGAPEESPVIHSLADTMWHHPEIASENIEELLKDVRL